MEPNVFACDLDGTILTYEPGMAEENKFGKPLPGIIDELKKIRAAGWKVVIWTVRPDSDELREALRDHEIPHDAVNENPWVEYEQSNKIFAHVYYDDRSLIARGPVKGLAERVFASRDTWYNGGHMQAPLPKPWGVLYADPNPDGSRKSCSNCPVWVKKTKQCIVHDPSMKISQSYVCGYHIYGEPTEAYQGRFHPQNPKQTGLKRVPGGTSCDNCRHFNGKDKCWAVATEVGVPGAYVDPKGCCARWER